MWDNLVKSEEEIVTIFKTRSQNWEFLKTEIETIHPYDCPCIIKIDAECNEKYREWVYDETTEC